MEPGWGVESPGIVKIVKDRIFQMSAGRRAPVSMLAGTLGVGVVAVCCLPVVGWLGVQLLMHPGEIVRTLQAEWGVMLASVLYAGSSAAAAVVVGLPVAVVLGRGRDRVAMAFAAVMMLGLLQPSIVYTYAWVQLLR